LYFLFIWRFKAADWTADCASDRDNEHSTCSVTAGLARLESRPAKPHPNRWTEHQLATRYLTDAYALEDKDAAREALSVIQGNYAPEIISAPDVFQDIAQVGLKKIKS
jgi:hypothetical protein